MTWFDFGVFMVLGVSVVISLFHGLVREMISLGGWVGGFVLATLFGGRIAGLMPQSLSPTLAALVGFLLVFIVVLAISWIVGQVLSSAVRASGLAPADRALGAIFGLARGFIIVLVVVLVSGLTPLPRETFWRDAVLSGPFETAALALRPLMPEGFAHRLKYR